jgi:hypothetical protein
MTWVGGLRNKDDIRSLPHSLTFLFAVVVMTETSISLPLNKNSITQFRRKLVSEVSAEQGVGAPVGAPEPIGPRAHTYI